MPIRLLAPARISFANGLSVQGMRIGLRQAVLEASGRISPTLNLTARLHDVPASLAALANPGLAMSGTLDAEATLTGKVLDTTTIQTAAAAAWLIEPISDIHAGGDYRRHLAQVLSARALTDAAQRAGVDV